MTRILSREKEFLKINEELDNMTKYPADKSQSTKVDSKFSTYTKKGPIILIREGNAGKGDDITVSGTKEKNAHTLPKDSFSVRGARKKVLPKDRLILKGIEEEKINQQPVELLDIKSPRNSARPLPSTRNTVGKNGSDVIVRYKNNSFLQSPSSVALVKDENDTLRSQTTSRSSTSNAVSTGRLKVNLSSEGLVKLAILQEENDTLTHEMTKQKELVERSIDRQKKVESQRDLAFIRNNALSEQITKIEGQLDEALRRLKETGIEHNATRKELEAARRELKVLTQTNANLEKRLYRTNEELENAKNTLNQMKSAEKEVKESIRSEADTRGKQIKSLKKQRTDLLNAYKKQLFLIDNLKRQNLCLEQSRMISFGEKEFTKVLNWETKN